jgi:hypothetical protein
LDGLRIHDLRHTYVSLMIAAGANPKEVSTWAGHSSVSFTLDRYGHLYDEHGDDVADGSTSCFRKADRPLRSEPSGEPPPHPNSNQPFVFSSKRKVPS